MTKYNILAIVFFTLIATAGMSQAYEHCDTKTLKDTCKQYLDRPFKYDASNTILISFQKRPQMKEIELPMFMGEEYRIIFNTYALPPGVEIHVYNKDADHDNRKELFSCNSSDASKKIFIWDCPHYHSKIFVDYVIPAKHDNGSGTDDSPAVEGCGILVVGYK